MARLPRLVLPDQPHHIIQRGNNRHPIFFADEDYQHYLLWLQEAAEAHGCSIHAYVLMTNHVHLLITPEEEDSIARTVQTLGRRYVRHINHTYRRSGTLWEGRYKSSLIDSAQYLLTCYRYIELNPVRAAMVSHPADYPWSSYHHNANGMDDTLLQQHHEYQALGDTTAIRQQAYRKLFDAHIEQTSLEMIRKNTNKGWVLGNERFKGKIEHQLKRRVSPLPRGGDHRSSADKKKSKLL
jgi:putative transposase